MNGLSLYDLPEKKKCPVMFPDTQAFRNGKLHGYDDAIDKVHKELSKEIVIDVEELTKAISIYCYSKPKGYEIQYSPFHEDLAKAIAANPEKFIKKGE